MEIVKAGSFASRIPNAIDEVVSIEGKKADTHQLLSEIYGWFTEGFDARDLQEERALLEELT